MYTAEKLPSFRILTLISTPKLADRASDLLKSSGLITHYRITGLGTAPSEMMDLLGLGDVDKALILAVLPKESAASMLKTFKKELKLGQFNTGIAFTLPLKSGTNFFLRLLADGNPDENHPEKETISMNSNQFSLLCAIVNPGYSADVMNAARAAGAGGGTVIHSRQIANDEKLAAHGLPLQDEKEIVLIVTREEGKAAIMNAISTACGMQSEAKGHVISLPIDAVKGLGED